MKNHAGRNAGILRAPVLRTNRAAPACDETLRDITRKYGGVMSVARSSGDASMLTFQLIGAAFVLLCLAPLLARDPSVRRSSR